MLYSSPIKRTSHPPRTTLFQFTKKGNPPPPPPNTPYSNLPYPRKHQSPIYFFTYIRMYMPACLLIHQYNKPIFSPYFNWPISKESIIHHIFHLTNKRTYVPAYLLIYQYWEPMSNFSPIRIDSYPRKHFAPIFHFTSTYKDICAGLPVDSPAGYSASASSTISSSA